MSRAGGAYPTDVLSALQELKQEQILPVLSKVRTVVQDGVCGGSNVDVAQGKEHTGSEHQDSLMVLDTSNYFGDPHPADYDWRYSSSSLALLSKRASRTLQAGGRLALFGCPTLFPSACVSRAQSHAVR